MDQNDGDVIIDSATFPGTSYADQNVIPGTYHYYGIYLQISNTPPFLWERAAFASCLSPVNEGSGKRLFELLPTYFRELQNGELTTSAAGDVFLEQFLNVIGWGMDYLRSQYDVLYKHLNDPLAIPLGDLVNLAGEVGMPFQPELPASTMRKALANWAHVCQQRGTPGGLSEHITILTGYPVDLQSGRNKMLEQDQSATLSPAIPAWNANISYVLNELVQSGNFIYKCIQATTNLGNAPTGTTSANTWWTVQQNVTDPGSTLANSSTVGGVNTWQALYPSLDSGGSQAIPAGSLVGTIGLINPLNSSDWKHSAFSVFNKAGTTQDIMLRSVSQVAADRTGSNTSMAPDQLQAVKDGIPIPRYNTTTNGWLASQRYATNDLVLYNGVLYQALRASTNAPPPSPGSPLNANPFFETDASHWTAQGSATIAQSSTQALQGTSSLRVTPNGTTANPGAVSDALSVIPGATYVLNPLVYLASAWSTVLIGITWLDAFGQTISTSSSTTSVGATAWTQLTLTATAPASAATGKIQLQLTGTPASSVLSYWDCVIMACWQTPEWAVLSRDGRLRMMFSGYVAQALTVGTNQTVPVVPFIEFYDDGGNLITSNGMARLTARTAVAGTAGGAPNLTYDSFGIGGGTFLNGRMTDSKDQTWTVKTGSFQVSQYADGSVYPASAGTRSVATVTGLAGASGTPIWLGTTFASTVPSGTDAGVVFRMVDLTSYWRAGMTGLYKVTGSSASLVGTYAMACQPGDRLVVSLNGNNITVYRNGVSVLSTTDSYNATATIHGLAVEGVTV